MAANFETVQRNRRILLVLTAILFLSSVFTLSAKFCSSAAREALDICARSVIPSLFPFMVLSAIASSVASRITASGRRVSVLTAAILGSLCGFPVGASVTAAMYRNGIIPRRRAEYMAGFCNNTGPAFVVDVIGRSFWGSSIAGWMFYICQISSSLILFLLWRLLFRRRAEKQSVTSAPYFDKRKSSAISIDQQNAADIFCGAVSSSSAAVIRICGYIVFFYVTLRLIEVPLAFLRAPQLVFAGISAVLEFTTGTSVAASVGGHTGVMLCAFSLGFSGISVMAQSSGILTSVGLSPSPMFRLKLCEGVICSLLSLVAADIFDISSPASAGAVCAFPRQVSVIPSAVSLTLIFIWVAALIVRRVTSAQNT